MKYGILLRLFLLLCFATTSVAARAEIKTLGDVIKSQEKLQREIKDLSFEWRETWVVAPEEMNRTYQFLEATSITGEKFPPQTEGIPHNGHGFLRMKDGKILVERTADGWNVQTRSTQPAYERAYYENGVWKSLTWGPGMGDEKALREGRNPSAMEISEIPVHYTAMMIMKLYMDMIESDRYRYELDTERDHPTLLERPKSTSGMLRKEYTYEEGFPLPAQVKMIGKNLEHLTISITQFEFDPESPLTLKSIVSGGADDLSGPIRPENLRRTEILNFKINSGLTDEDLRFERD